MRNTYLNFQQPKSLPFFFTLLMILLLTACQKEQANELEGLEKTSIEETTDEEEKVPGGDITKELILESTVTSEGASSRSATYLMYTGTFSVGQFNWRNFYYTRPSLPDPNVWRVEVTIRPISGNPNLYLYGYDQDLGNPWRYIRRSTNPGLADDKVSFRETGMKAGEERMYMSVYGATAATFEITIAAVTVDCEEYPAADTWVTLEYNPVCGCNGVEFPNPSSARVAGLTSWTVGPCGPAIDGFWRNVDANTRGITKMKIENNSQSVHIYGSCFPTDCDWGKEPLTYDGRCYNAKYEHGFATRFIKLHLENNGRVRMEIKNDYHDTRPDRTDVYYFEE